jgi:nitrate/nitrite-specific signal transduction histidine kinase
MNDNELNQFKEELQLELDNELDLMPTFSEEMAEHIRNVYADLNKQREEWLKTHQPEQKEELL